MLRKNVKSLLEQFQVCIFAEIVFGVRCTLTSGSLFCDRRAAERDWHFAWSYYLEMIINCFL